MPIAATVFIAKVLKTLAAAGSRLTTMRGSRLAAQKHGTIAIARTWMWKGHKRITVPRTLAVDRTAPVDERAIDIFLTTQRATGLQRPQIATLGSDASRQRENRGVKQTLLLIKGTRASSFALCVVLLPSQSSTIALARLLAV
jgi:hypothetical protein